ncbi:TetR family transcriptional regulator [Streptomyces avermitilis]|uniref:TetR-family transcriptional regulator n=1 Tax=Streptomyces avermitilis (strain ATCC 31267 / DSM 46492 / JCM 5070 / NBRC 14893 / NCIMB 12804 / NRRL 8165 / MA-4680) TaxID=227882 RepID=Q82Q16_STRAW|nr:MULTISPECIES: TetR/AcrR family transcriptional regulator [Streptomyces]KUN50642.1 TetR family transcriptional regulator [Streptomyces avermitilis]MYS96364.1 TetR family transcriptional regulator [Streptomyces sp. SID5469]OOV21785.1 TetR family transcriptional regulator [Streptomyces avermitilis]BAC68415.1 putative TetR-family transcriptional regulator [Streptomyces avermitilis MA-4680 = NBRC 14893]
MARPRQFDEEEVVRAARDQFWSVGYNGTSIDDLSAVTGLGRGSLYGAFEDKHALFLRALDSYNSDALRAWRTALGGPGPALPMLERHVRNVADGIIGDVERRGCMMAKIAAELSAVDEGVAERIAAVVRGLHGALRGCITRAQAEGSLDADADPDSLASLLLAVLRGLEALGKAGATPEVVNGAAEQALALLPRVSPDEHAPGTRSSTGA